MDKRGRGRPALPPDERKGQVLRLRIADEDKAAIKAAADKAGLSMSEWALERLLDAARVDGEDDRRASNG